MVVRGALADLAHLLDYDALELEQRTRGGSLSGETGGADWEKCFIGGTSWIYQDRVASSRYPRVDLGVRIQPCEAGQFAKVIDSLKSF